MGWTSFTYDSRGRLSNEQHRDSSNTSLNNTTFTYDNFDRLTTKKVNGTTTTYSYDDTNQLTSDGTRNYSFDANGNRNSTGYTTGTGNQTTNDGTWTYTYDNEGNLTKKVSTGEAHVCGGVRLVCVIGLAARFSWVGLPRSTRLAIWPRRLARGWKVARPDKFECGSAHPLSTTTD